jgi:hypothetical protein
LIQSVFLPVDVERVLTIPLSAHLTYDFVAWHKSKSCTFYVRSAYYVEWEHQFGSNVCRRDGQGNSCANPVWDYLWKLQVASKVEKFLVEGITWHGTYDGYYC